MEMEGLVNELLIVYDSLSMKVLFTMGGVSHYIAPLFDAIARKGIEVVVLIPESQKKTIIGKGVKLVEQKSLFSVRKSEHRKKWYGKLALEGLTATILEEKPNIVVLGWPYFLQYFFSYSLRSALKRVKAKLIIREIPFQTPPFGKLSYFKKHPAWNENMENVSKGFSFYVKAFATMHIRKYIYKRADATINYASVAKEILPSYGMSLDSIFVTYNTVDTNEAFKQKEKVLALPHTWEKKPRIIHIGRLVKWKRVDLLIDAFNIVVKQIPDAELVIVGDGPEKEILEKQVQVLGLEEKIVFTGAIHDAFLLGQHMNESSVYVLAGMGGLSINEAMCYSLPIVCSVCDGTERDLITDGVNGYFFKENDVNSLSEKIETLLLNPKEAAAMGERSLKIIKEKINTETVSQRFIDAFEYVSVRT